MNSPENLDEINKLLQDAMSRRAFEGHRPKIETFADKGRAARSQTLKLAGQAAILLSRNHINPDIKLYNNKYKIPLRSQIALIEAESGWAMSFNSRPRPNSGPRLNRVTSTILLTDGALLGVAGLELRGAEQERQILVDYYYGSRNRMGNDISGEPSMRDGWGYFMDAESRLQNSIADYLVSKGVTTA